MFDYGVCILIKWSSFQYIWMVLLHKVVLSSTMLGSLYLQYNCFPLCSYFRSGQWRKKTTWGKTKSSPQNQVQVGRGVEDEVREFLDPVAERMGGCCVGQGRAIRCGELQSKASREPRQVVSGPEREGLSTDEVVKLRELHVWQRKGTIWKLRLK